VRVKASHNTIPDLPNKKLGSRDGRRILRKETAVCLVNFRWILIV
jgi:hypothetical protein